MMKSKLRQNVAHFLPDPLIRVAKSAEMYGMRMKKILRIARDIKGQSRDDRVILLKSVLLGPLFMLRGLGSWREPFLLADAEIVSRDMGRFFVRERCDDLAHVMISHDTEFFDTVRKHVRRGETVIDAGANIGGVTVFLAHQVGPSGQVLAFEMMPDTAVCLRRNVRLNCIENVTIVERALSNLACDQVMAEVVPGLFGQASIATEIRGKASEKRRICVETATLDQFTTNMTDIALLKLDLEGGELPALQGARQTLKKTRAVVFEDWHGKTEISELLCNHGFKIERVFGINRLALRVDG